jgi:hypothetical protein
MRLTLRTLLAYLDDTLDPEQAKLIGQKVAESPVAQELIERLKKVTRRRSLANPPVLGDSSRLDANTVAEYLDSKLSPEELSQVEQTCLEDDVYLAEVAACHQILTLMLSEPTRVPPTARQRMYRLVKGRESIPYRKPPEFPADVNRDGPIGKSEDTSPSRWGLYVAGAAVMIVGLAVSITLAWPKPQSRPKGSAVAATLPKDHPNPGDVPAPPGTSNKEPPKPDNPKADAPKPMADVPKPMPPMPDVPKPMIPMPDPPKKPLDAPPANEPSSERREIGEVVSPASALVEHRGGPKDTWQSLLPKARLMTATQLMSLPGSRSDLKLDSGVQLSLWGSLLEFMPFAMFESAVMLHVSPAGFDADLTLDRGRIVLSSQKPAKVRLRFRTEIWDLSLSEKNEVIVDLMTSNPGGARFSKQPGGESPMSQVFLGVLKGKTVLVVGDLKPVELTAPLGPGGPRVPALIGWDNKGKIKEPERLVEVLPHWTGALPTKSPVKEAAAEMKAVVDALVKRLAEKGATPSLALIEMAESPKLSDQTYAAFALPAIDLIATLADALDDITKPALRGPAVLSLDNWIARPGDNGLALHQMLINKKGYSESQADAVLQLLHNFSEQDIAAVGTYELLFDLLNNEKLSVRELALWQLLRLDPEGAKTSMYNPVVDDRTPAINRWRKRLTEGKLPPKAPKPMGEPTPKPMGNGPAAKPPGGDKKPSRQGPS